MRPVRVTAPAKLNLTLHVVGRRPDGYHLLDSLVAFADIADVVEARPAERLSLEVTGPFAEAIEGENLVLSAARLLGGGRGAAIRLEKNLPVASGIGGGSSDAAAALLALSQLWGIAIPPDLPARLGADVPVCLVRRPMWLAGIGEKLEPAPALPECGVVLANPLVPLATPSVFKARRGPFSTPERFSEPPADAAALAALIRSRRNDLTEAAIALVPAIAEILAALEGALVARMSGSGATCFGLYADAEFARRAAAAIARPGWWVAAGRLVTPPPAAVAA
ncbi:MAG: 4-(cytidine 5'-diphospho)-2-C-methyl-D-erythritol kinase [Rhodospirillales bacterium]|nr:4-(cytidine 5'-diphospho)-2-C-methyl-D-erythritol kinase [Rhodospirillales bacterium]